MPSVELGIGGRMGLSHPFHRFPVSAPVGRYLLALRNPRVFSPPATPPVEPRYSQRGILNPGVPCVTGDVAIALMDIEKIVSKY